MPCSATLAKLAEIIAAKPINLSDAAILAIASITTDTRNINPGDVFVALRGENFDGHEFVTEAIAKGAIAAIVTQDFASTDLPVLQVKDTLQAYQHVYQSLFEQAIIPFLADFQPDLLIVSAGYDANAADPLANIDLQPQDYRILTNYCLQLTRRVLFGLEGGYDLESLSQSVLATVEQCLA
jgi:hypothetical protein